MAATKTPINVSITVDASGAMHAIAEDQALARLARLDDFECHRATVTILLGEMYDQLAAGSEEWDIGDAEWATLIDACGGTDPDFGGHAEDMWVARRGGWTVTRAEWTTRMLNTMRDTAETVSTRYADGFGWAA